MEIVSAKGARALGQSVGGGGADGPRAAHDHFPDGPRRGAEIGHGHDLELMRQQPLLDEQDGVFPGVEGNGAIVPGASFHGDIHIKWRRRFDDTAAFRTGGAGNLNCLSAL